MPARDGRGSKEQEETYQANEGRTKSTRDGRLREPPGSRTGAWYQHCTLDQPSFAAPGYYPRLKGQHNSKPNTEDKETGFPQQSIKELVKGEKGGRRQSRRRRNRAGASLREQRQTYVWKRSPSSQRAGSNQVSNSVKKAERRRKRKKSLDTTPDLASSVTNSLTTPMSLIPLTRTATLLYSHTRTSQLLHTRHAVRNVCVNTTLSVLMYSTSPANTLE